MTTTLALILLSIGAAISAGIGVWLGILLAKFTLEDTKLLYELHEGDK